MNGMVNNIVFLSLLINIIMIFLFLESLCGCFDDLGSCCYGFWCTSCLFGSNAEKIDNSSCIGMCCVYNILLSCGICWIPHMMKRGDLRRKYNLRADPCDDCPITFCCGPCALCQEARFLNRRGRFFHSIVFLICLLFLQVDSRVLLLDM